MSLPKKDTMQLDIDRENLNKLMNEIYDTVTAVCNMDDHKPGSFPTESDGSTSEDSVKISRSLTEKRKNYVRRVSSRVAYLAKNVNRRYRHQTSICSYKSEIVDNPYSTFRSWKSFRTSQNNLTKDKMNESDSKNNLTDASGQALSVDFSDGSIDNVSIDDKTGCVDLPFEARDKGLFNISLLVGLNYMTGEAYVKSIFPSQVHVPPHIENLIFPETLSWTSNGEWSADASAQCYSLVLTDERGERSYGYCRRVLPEGATTCLPLCYCVIGKYRAPGFYYKVLQEIESHHGSSETEIQSILQQLFDTNFPSPGEEITIKYTNGRRHSIEMDAIKSKTMPDMRRSGGGDEKILEGFSDKAESLGDELPRFLDLENNNEVRSGRLTPRRKVLKRPIEPRADEDNLSVLLDSLGAGLVIKVFGSLLLERKVIIISDQLNVLSSCMEALQSSLYPLVWQQPLISCIPSAIQRDVLEAPLPILAGMLTCKPTDSTIHEGMLIDLTHPSKVLHYQGDESTILPTSSYKTLKTSLQMESLKYKDRTEDSKTRNVMISEAFLRFFVDILGDFWQFFSEGEVKDGALGRGGVVFDKEAFKKSATSKQNQYFLEWFTETAMFNHFIQNMAVCHRTSSTTPTEPLADSELTDLTLVDAPLPNFYQLFEERVRCRTKVDSQKNSDVKNYKSAVNKKVKLLKTKLRDLIT
ncbi:LOW QUALITY PROTEIN: DENN domain-containing protein 2A-like [Aphomia sociella]